MCANPFKMYMYVPCQESFSWLCSCVWLQQLPQLFVGDVYGIREQIEKNGVEVDTTSKVTGKAFDPSILLSAKGLQLCDWWAVLYLSRKLVKIMFWSKIAFSKSENVKALYRMVGKFSRIRFVLFSWKTLFWDELI